MATTAAAPAPPPTLAAGRTRLWWDAALLVVVLALSAAFVGRGLYTVDEGAYLAQARWVDSGDPWLQPYVAPDLVPGPDPAPLALSTRTDEGWAPFVKAPAYVWLLVAARQLHPAWGPVALSAAGLVAAAALAARLSHRLAPGSGRTGFWLVGAASPLFVHAHVVWAHTLAVAAALAGLVGLLAMLDGRRPRVAPALAFAGLAGAVALRGEALLLGPAAAAVLLLTARRGGRRRAAGAAAVALAATVAGQVANDVLVRLALGGAGPSRLAPAPGRVPADVAHSAWNNLLSPGGGQGSAITARLLSVAVLAFVVLRLARSRPADRVVLWALLAGAVAAGVYGATAPATYQGLLAASPLLVVGVVAALAHGAGPGQRRLAAIGAAACGLVVLASEPLGGGLGWGGRYLLVAAAAFAPVAAVGVRRLVGSGDALAVALVAATVVVTGAVQVAAVGRLHRAHAATAAAAPLLEADLAELGAGQVLLVTADLRVGRLAPDVARHLPLLSVTPDELPALLVRIQDRGLPPPLLVGLPGAPPADLPPGWAVVGEERLRALDVATLATSLG